MAEDSKEGSTTENDSGGSTSSSTKGESEPEPTVDPLPSLEHITPKHLADLEAKLRGELQAVRTEHATEREQLKAQIATLEEHKDKLEQAERDKDKVRESESTLVLPPEDIPPQQPTPPPSEPIGEDGGKRRSRWKSAW